MVKMFASWSFEFTKLEATYPDAIFYLMKWRPLQYGWSFHGRLGWVQYVSALDLWLSYHIKRQEEKALRDRKKRLREIKRKGSTSLIE